MSMFPRSSATTLSCPCTLHNPFFFRAVHADSAPSLHLQRYTSTTYAALAAVECSSREAQVSSPTSFPHHGQLRSVCAMHLLHRRHQFLYAHLGIFSYDMKPRPHDLSFEYPYRRNEQHAYSLLFPIALLENKVYVRSIHSSMDYRTLTSTWR